MAKGWVSIETVNTRKKDYDRNEISRNKRDNSFNLLIRNTKTLSAEEIKKNSEDLYLHQQLEDAKLLEAFEKKRVKSKTAIKRAIRLKRELAKKENKEV